MINTINHIIIEMNTKEYYTQAIISYFNQFESKHKIVWSKLPTEIKDYLLTKYYWAETIQEAYSCFKNNINEMPICPICGKKLKFTNKTFSDKPYPTYCSTKCRSNDPKWLEKQKNTKLLQYGDSNYNNRIQYKQTCVKKYGTENTFQAEEIKEKIKQSKYIKYNDEFYNNKEQVQKTCLERYGTKMPLCSEEIQNKCKQTIKTKYNVDNIMELESSKEKIEQTCLKKYGVTSYSKTDEYKKRIQTEDFQE